MAGGTHPAGGHGINDIPLGYPEHFPKPYNPEVTSEIQKGFYNMGYSITLNPITLLPRRK
jgi:hypothetical protein